MTGSGRVVLRRGTAVVMVAALALSACGGGGGSKDKAESGGGTTTTTAGKPKATTTTEEATTTTTKPKIPSSPYTTLATMTPKDLGGDWRVYPDKPAEGAGSAGNCDEADPKGALDAVDAQSQGDILQRGEAKRYIQTTTAHLPSPAAAEAFLQVRMSDAYIECERGLTEKTLSQDPDKQTITTDSVERRKVEDGPFRGTYTFLFNTDFQGEQKYTGSYSYHWLYVKGAYVVDAFIQVVQESSDEKALDDATYGEFVKAMNTVMARVPA